MPIQRCSAQSQETLEGFYKEMLGSSFDEAIGKAMLSFLDMINRTFKETKIWGLTSLYQLKLLSQDDWKSDWYVSVIGNDHAYYFEFLLPTDQSPWENARVIGEAKTLSEAKKYLIIAITKSQGWIESEELIKLSTNLNI